jgi:hypothetical protein
VLLTFHTVIIPNSTSAWLGWRSPVFFYIWDSSHPDTSTWLNKTVRVVESVHVHPACSTPAHRKAEACSLSNKPVHLNPKSAQKMFRIQRSFKLTNQPQRPNSWRHTEQRRRATVTSTEAHSQPFSALKSDQKLHFVSFWGWKLVIDSPPSWIGVNSCA